MFCIFWMKSMYLLFVDVLHFVVIIIIKIECDL